MLEDFQLIQAVYEYGHFFSPEALKLELVKEKDLPTLTLDDAVVKVAIRSAQSFMAPTLDHITMKLGQPITSHTGDVDEATRLLFETPRCGHPDFLPPDMKAKLSGVGSWPDPCQKVGVWVSFDKSKMPSQIQDMDAVRDAVFAAYAAVGLKMVEAADPNKANIQVVWMPLRGSVIGLSDFNNGSCNNQVLCRLDTNYWGYMRSLMCHEMGHNCNLQHTRGGIMNPVITPDPSPFGWHTDDPSFPVLTRFFGGQPITPVPTPAPIPTPTPTPSGGTLKLPITMIDADGKKYNLSLYPQV